MSLNFKFLEIIPTVDEYQNLRNSVGWPKVNDKSVESALGNSLYSVCVYDEKKLIGYGRIIGDKGIYYYIQDMIVLPRYQGKGIGRKIMSKIMDFLEKNADPTAFFGLMAAKGFFSFYKPYGFKKRPEDAPGMFRYGKKE
jgi:GNAT superfamily N-acetyltransferase